MSEQINAKWHRLSGESVRKIQDLEAVVAFNSETIEALLHSVDVHTKGLELLTGEELEVIRDQFGRIITSHTNSKDNLVSFNENARAFLNQLVVLEDANAIQIIENLLKIVAFK